VLFIAEFVRVLDNLREKAIAMAITAEVLA
jgi:hypothetical protein